MMIRIGTYNSQNEPIMIGRGGPEVVNETAFGQYHVESYDDKHDLASVYGTDAAAKLLSGERVPSIRHGAPAGAYDKIKR